MDFVVIIMISLISIFVIGGIIMASVKGIMEWNKNNHSPKLTVDATVVTKRENVSGGANNHSHSTTYYVTFQVESKDRMEFRVSGTEYGMLVEGDYGRLTFQGTRYLGFERM